MQRTPEVTDRGRRLALVGGINALPSSSGDFLARIDPKEFPDVI